MIWKKEIASYQRDVYGLLEIVALISFIASLLMNRPLLIVVTGILMAFVVANKIYDKRIGDQLVLENKKASIHLFLDKKGYLTFKFENHSILPINNGKLSFIVEDIVEIKNFEKQEVGENKLKYIIPITITGKGETEIKVPFVGLKRGVTYIKGIELVFPHFLNFQRVHLVYKPFYQTELMIYPKPLMVSSTKEASFNTIGKQQTNFSTYEDVLNPVGTRDYVRSDPFNRIHWKATVRKQTLQTKVLEKTRDNTWVFILNLSTVSRAGNSYFTKDMENILSHVTYMCHYATKQGIPFEIYINTKRGSRYYAGEGKEHLKGALEFLAHVTDQVILIPFHKYLSRLDTHLQQPRTVIIFGEMPTENREFLTKWNRKGMQLYHVNESEHGAVMDVIKKERKSNVRK